MKLTSSRLLNDIFALWVSAKISGTTSLTHKLIFTAWSSPARDKIFCFPFALNVNVLWLSQPVRAYAREGGLGFTPITYAKEFVYDFVHFLLVWCQLNAKTTEWYCMKISRNTVNGPKRNNCILVGIWVIACIEEPSHHFLQTSRRLRIFMLVLRDSSLYS